MKFGHRTPKIRALFALRAIRLARQAMSGALEVTPQGFYYRSFGRVFLLPDSVGALTVEQFAQLDQSIREEFYARMSHKKAADLRAAPDQEGAVAAPGDEG